MNDWQGQTAGFPESNQPWSTETGNITAGFRSQGGWIFRGTKFKGDLPGKTPLPKFQFFPSRATITKSNNRASYKRKINYVPQCGGELGECSGDEKSGIESTSRNCKRPNSRIPIEFVYDKGGFTPVIKVVFGSHRSMNDFCGPKYGGEASIDQLPKTLKIPRALDDIAELERGQQIVRTTTVERGWVGGDGHPDGARNLKKCPAMSGVGSRQCWITDIRVEIKRIK